MKTMKAPSCALAAACTLLLLASTPANTASIGENPNTGDILYEVSDSPWMDSRGFLTPNTHQLAKQVQDSVFHGLNPEQYELKRIAELSQAQVGQPLGF